MNIYVILNSHWLVKPGNMRKFEMSLSNIAVHFLNFYIYFGRSTLNFRNWKKNFSKIEMNSYQLQWEIFFRTSVQDVITWGKVGYKYFFLLRFMCDRPIYFIDFYQVPCKLPFSNHWSFEVALNKVTSPRCLGHFPPFGLLYFLSKILQWEV